MAGWLKKYERMARSGLAVVAVVCAVVFVLSGCGPSYPEGSWSAQDPMVEDSFYGVDFIDSSTGWAVGTETFAYFTSDGGATWLQQDTPTIRDMAAVSFVNATTGWIAAGNFYTDNVARGDILTTIDGGANWSIQYASAEYTFNDIQFLDADNGWATAETYYDVTDGGKVAVFRTADGGDTWTEIDVSSIAEGLKGLFFLNATHGWACGQAGTMINTSDGGETWTAQTTGTESWLYDVFFVDESTGWIAADPLSFGTTRILHTRNGGETWSEQVVPESIPGVRALCFVDENLGWATGRDGAMITTTNGGYTWTVVTTGVPEWINAVDFVDDSNGWAVGLAGLILNYSVGM